MSERNGVNQYIYDWNIAGTGYPHRETAVEFNDETLRDGLQSPSVRDPPIGKKIELLHLMAQLGIHAVDLGLPGAGPRARRRHRGVVPRDPARESVHRSQLRGAHRRPPTSLL